MLQRLATILRLRWCHRPRPAYLLQQSQPAMVVLFNKIIHQTLYISINNKLPSLTCCSTWLKLNWPSSSSANTGSSSVCLRSVKGTCREWQCNADSARLF